MYYQNKKVYKDKKGYLIIWIDGRDKKVHILEWERYYGKKPLDCDVHHIDFDKGNYRIGNLQLLTKSEHYRIHAGWVRVSGAWVAKRCNGCNRVLPLEDFYPRTTVGSYTALCKPCHKQVCKERMGDPLVQDRNREYQKLWARRKRQLTSANCSQG